MANYIDNKALYRAFVEYKKDISQCKKSGKSPPKIPDYIGECILMIATRLASRANFCNYTFKSDMIGDGIENSILYLHNFNPNKSKNPFAYFTKIIYFAFIRRIQKEKKQLYIKRKSVENLMIFDEVVHHGQGDHKPSTFIDLDNEKMNDLVRAFEADLAKKKVKRGK